MRPLRRGGPVLLALLLLAFLLLALLPASAPSIGRAAGACDGAPRPPAQIMASVVESMRDNAFEELLALLPKERGLTLTSTIEAPFRSESYSPSSVRSDFVARQGVYDVVIGAESDDAFRDAFVATDFAPWVATTAERFIPPGPQYRDGRTFLRLGCEGGTWVVVELGWPAS